MKRSLTVLPLAVLLCFGAGCRDREARAKLGDYEAGAEVVQRNKDIVKRWISEMDKGNLGIVDDLILRLYFIEDRDRKDPRALDGPKCHNGAHGEARIGHQAKGGERVGLILGFSFSAVFLDRLRYNGISSFTR